MTKLVMAGVFVIWLASSSLAQQSSAEVKNWEEKYQQLLKERPEIRKKVESGNATKEQVIEWLKQGGDKQQYKSGKRYYGWKVEVKDPAEFFKSQAKAIYSGPQPGEKLPNFLATGLRGELKRKKYDPVAAAGGKPIVLIFQDNSVVGQKGLLLCGPVLERIAEKAPHGLHVSATFLVDDPTPSLIFRYDFMNEINDVIQMSVSRDRRDGPGAYGLNRNVAMTIIVAKDGRVLYNFPFTQPMLYPDPHVIGAIAEVVGEDRQTVLAWLQNDEHEDVRAKQGDTDLTARQTAFKKRLGELVEAGKLNGNEAAELYRLAFP